MEDGISKFNFKKPLVIIAGALLFVGGACLVSGCGGGSSGGNTPPETPPDMSGLPPDPGEAGKATLAGVDSNNNNTRDDMEIAIYGRYPNDSDKRDALNRGARVLQDAVLVGDAIMNSISDPDQPFVVSRLGALMVRCCGERFGAGGLQEIGFLEGILTNTDARQNAYSEYNGAVDKQSSGLPDTDTPCQDLNI